LAAWRVSGDPVPVIWSHDWGTPDAHIGRQVDRSRLEQALGFDADLINRPAG
jgi:hypothetical protein